MRRLLTVIQRFFGTDLPARVLPLQFVLPKLSGRVEASNSSDGDLNRQLDEAKDRPQEYFRVLLAEIKHVNRCSLKTQQRLTLTRDIVKLYYPMALAQIARHAKTGGIPEDEDRKQTLNQLVDIAQILITSYQILFAFYYGSSNYKYARARDTVLECASRIFELMQLKQQARALRYQLLAEQDWQVANTLFYVLSRYEDVEQPLPTLKQELELGGSRTDVCLSEHYSCLQMVARFDMLRWPTHLQWIIIGYLQGVEQAVQIRTDEGGSKLGRDELIAYCYGGQQACGQMLDSPPGPAMIFNCSGLNNAIRKDCMGLMQANRDGSAIPPRFARLPGAEHFVISDQLLRGVESLAGDACTEKETRVEDLRIFVGFAEVFSLLRHKQGLYGSEDRLADMLAKRSALLAEDHIATEKSVWTLLFQNEKMIRLSTQETSFTTPMSIGSLVAYGVGEDIARPSLAVVSRIYRPSHKVVVIDMNSIANYAEAVTMTVNATEQTQSGMTQAKPALLVYNKKRLGGWGLMFPPMDILPGFDKLAMRRNKQEFAISLENRCNATTDFYLFSTPSLSAQLGIAGEPDYATPPARKMHSPGWLI
ncbi:MAG: hypothetical protein WC208_04350 [Gallionella sp.]|jgi:hypothetical protein